MVKSLELEIVSTNSKPKCKIRSTLYTDAPTTDFINILEDSMDSAKNLWEKVSAIPSTSRRTENFYKVWQTDCGFLFFHPAPSLFLTDEVQTKHHHNSHSAVADKKGHRINVLG